jgi:hypothetical protein
LADRLFQQFDGQPVRNQGRELGFQVRQLRRRALGQTTPLTGWSYLSQKSARVNEFPRTGSINSHNVNFKITARHAFPLQACALLRRYRTDTRNLVWAFRRKATVLTRALEPMLRQRSDAQILECALGK